MRRPLQEHLEGLLVWCERTRLHVSGHDRDRFVDDIMMIDAVCKCVENIGEGSGRLMQDWPELADEVPELALRKAYGMRNRLAHAYDEVDLVLLWATANESIPVFEERLRELLNRIEGGEEAGDEDLNR